MKFAVVAHRRSATNEALVAAARAWGLESELLDPHAALTSLEPGDVALARLDVREGLDGIERGTGELERLAAGGVDVRNPPGTLVVAHDKLLTARALRLAGLPHPHTTLVSPALPTPVPELPVVLKPRFGSWGRDVERCTTSDEPRRSARPAAAKATVVPRARRVAQELVEREDGTCDSSSQAARRRRRMPDRAAASGGRTHAPARRSSRSSRRRSPGPWRSPRRGLRADLVESISCRPERRLRRTRAERAVDFRPATRRRATVFSETVAAARRRRAPARARRGSL
jgi:hypothetical protein